MDLDKEISNLECKSSFINFGSKALLLKIGISLIISCFLTYKSQSLIVFNAEYDDKEEEIKLKINYKNFIITTLILTFVIFIVLGYIPYFN
jgi:hypothetical protein